MLQVSKDLMRSRIQVNTAQNEFLFMGRGEEQVLNCPYDPPVLHKQSKGEADGEKAAPQTALLTPWGKRKGLWLIVQLQSRLLSLSWFQR